MTARKVLRLTIGKTSLDIASLFYDEVDDEPRWRLEVEPEDLANFIGGNSRIEVAEDSVVTREEFDMLHKSILDLRSEMFHLFSGINDSINGIEKAIAYKDLDIKYPKRESIASQQDAAELLRSAKEYAADSALPVQTRPHIPGMDPTVHDLTGRRPQPGTYREPLAPEVRTVVDESKNKVDYDAAATKAKSQPLREPAEMLAEAEAEVDAMVLPLGLCALDNQPSTTCICASCAADIYSFDPTFLATNDVDPQLPLTRGRARAIRAWLDAKRRDAQVQRELDAAKALDDEPKEGMPF